mgnify:FL=1
MRFAQGVTGGRVGCKRLLYFFYADVAQYRPTLIHDSFDILSAAQHSQNLNGRYARQVYHQVRIHGEEPNWPRCQIVSVVTGIWVFSKKLEYFFKPTMNTECRVSAVLCNIVEYFVKVFSGSRNKDILGHTITVCFSALVAVPP